MQNPRKFASQEPESVIRLTDSRRELFNLSSVQRSADATQAAGDVNSMTPISAGLTRVCKSRRCILHFRVNILSFTRDEYIKAQESRPPFGKSMTI